MFSRPDWKPWETVKNWRMKLLLRVHHDEDVASAHDPSLIRPPVHLEGQFGDSVEEQPAQFEE